MLVHANATDLVTLVTTLVVFVCGVGAGFRTLTGSGTGLSAQLLEVEPTSSSSCSFRDISSSYSSFDLLQTHSREREIKDGNATRLINNKERIKQQTKKEGGKGNENHLGGKMKVIVLTKPARLIG